jgi:hypothetical protein
MNTGKEEVFEFSHGEIVVSVHEESSVHLRSLTKAGDPVELNAEEARELAALLESLAKRIE